MKVIVIFLVGIILFASLVKETDAVGTMPNPPCNEVCNRGWASIVECCRAHGFRKLSLSQCLNGRAYCA